MNQKMFSKDTIIYFPLPVSGKDTAAAAPSHLLRSCNKATPALHFLLSYLTSRVLDSPGFKLPNNWHSSLIPHYSNWANQSVVNSAIPNRLPLKQDYSTLTLKWWSYSFSLTWEADSLTVTVDRLRGSKWASVVKINWFMLNTRSSFSVNSRYKYLNVSASTNESILTKRDKVAKITNKPIKANWAGYTWVFLNYYCQIPEYIECIR